MSELSFQDLSFRENRDKVEVLFLDIFYFNLEKRDFEKIGKFDISKNTVTFKNINQKEAGKKFNRLLLKGFSKLKNRIGNRGTTYIHKNSGIPLMGHIAFGIVDKNVSVIEVKPLTNCNVACIFCSVDLSRRAHDFVIEKDYLVQEIKKLVDFKDTDGIEINLNPHGEPTLYGDIVSLVKDLSNIRQIETISMNTNAVLLNEKFVDRLFDAGFTRFNVSLNAIDPEKARFIEGNKGYDVERVKNICRYIRKKGNMLIAPVWVSGISDSEIPKLIEFAKELDVPIRLQNFLVHRFGKKPAKQKQWSKFFDETKALEKKFKVRLTGDFDGFKLKKTKLLPKPFKKGDIINARIMCNGELPGEMVAVSHNRAIAVPDCRKKGNVKLEITRDKYNIFFGKVV